MKTPLVREVSKWMFRGYMVWSVCADIALLGGIVYLIFFWWGWIRIDWRLVEKWRIVVWPPYQSKN